MKGRKKTTFAGYVAGYVKNKPMRMYSKPKLYIVKKDIGGEKLPSIDSGAKWYVYFYYRDPSTGKMGNKPWRIYKDIPCCFMTSYDLCFIAY